MPDTVKLLKDITEALNTPGAFQKDKKLAALRYTTQHCRNAAKLQDLLNRLRYLLTQPA
ncbi:hypothetical protein [Hymenobacter sp. BT491]|uniref:hypothetical protein n=1 Tax=Hymenobacter sp. BT491 TaxID=2766779 RepID=UPI001653DFE4|nr:hypothetical protein [Hymenobacter sp. BT491]MBC6988982.1 hypothetical protein [Hymenobacter sp. BT491]